jgi:hypothetical protein
LFRQGNGLGPYLYLLFDCQIDKIVKLGKKIVQEEKAAVERSKDLP